MVSLMPVIIIREQPKRKNIGETFICMYDEYNFIKSFIHLFYSISFVIVSLCQCGCEFLYLFKRLHFGFGEHKQNVETRVRFYNVSVTKKAYLFIHVQCGNNTLCSNISLVLHMNRLKRKKIILFWITILFTNCC